MNSGMSTITSGHLRLQGGAKLRTSLDDALASGEEVPRLSVLAHGAGVGTDGDFTLDSSA